jgi:hypothetical protein
MNEKHLSQENLEVLVGNTVAVLREMPGKQAEWRASLTGLAQQAAANQDQAVVDLSQALLRLMERGLGQDASLDLPDDNPYAAPCQALLQELLGQTDDAADLPVPADLIPRAVAALRGGPLQQLALVQHLEGLIRESEAPGAVTLYRAIQKLLSEEDPAVFVQSLSGVYRQVWQALQGALALGDVDVELLEALVNNTLAVLGPAAHQKAAWLDNLAQLREGFSQRGDGATVALVDSVTGLLHANGDPQGLGQGLTGVHQQVWHAIVKRLGT